MHRLLLQHPGWEMVLPDVTEGFNLRLQISLCTGLLIAFPLVTLELSGFLVPGLPRSERNVCRVLFPFSLALFFLGAAAGYALTEPALHWFAGHVPADWRVMHTPAPYLTFMARLVVGLGAAFQAPVVVLLLAWMGLITAATLRRGWRLALVGCFAAAALITPGGKPLTMMLTAAPLALMYAVCVRPCTFMQWGRRRS